ncbi:MAG: hypothetical protein FE048_05620 [Thermoplasmata archaeon]|nr:MAG: hypothetical protein FE048_05620 [Thermoplasmata archaeon]
MEIISLIIGFVVGIVAVSLAIELGWRKEEAPETCKVAKRWNIKEIKNPLVVAEKIKMEMPEGARMVVAVETPYSKKAKVNPNAKGNFIIGDDRALIFSGEIREDQLAFWTIDENIMRVLRNQFYKLWEEREEKKVVSKEVPKKGGVTIRGLVRAVVPFRDRYLVRLSYEGGVTGILINERLDLEGRKIEVEGEVSEEIKPFINAYHIEVLE